MRFHILPKKGYIKMLLVLFVVIFLIAVGAVTFSLFGIPSNQVEMTTVTTGEDCGPFASNTMPSSIATPNHMPIPTFPQYDFKQAVTCFARALNQCKGAYINLAYNVGDSGEVMGIENILGRCIVTILYSSAWHPDIITKTYCAKFAVTENGFHLSYCTDFHSLDYPFKY